MLRRTNRVVRCGITRRPRHAPSASRKRLSLRAEDQALRLSRWQQDVHWIPEWEPFVGDSEYSVINAERKLGIRFPEVYRQFC